MTNLELLQKIADASEISDRQNAEIQVMLDQASAYIKFKALNGDLYAINLLKQMERAYEAAV